ncbi:MAG: c-type cytochrome [Sphingomonadales bacterium]|nr:c-type cytochrome [Sphingomonadales bacterium]
MGRVLSLFLVLPAFAIASSAMATDAASGARVFKAQCAICHATSDHAPSGIGPSLAGVVGRRAGSQTAFAARYSPAMRAAGRVWSEAALRAYIANPAKAVPGNHMPYAGLHNPAQVDDVVAYLQTLR